MNNRGGVEVARLWEWGGENTEGEDEFAKQRPGWEMPIHDLLVKHGVSIVFHGHDHLFIKQDLDGIVYQEVPQPGILVPATRTLPGSMVSAGKKYSICIPRRTQPTSLTSGIADGPIVHFDFEHRPYIAWLPWTVEVGRA